jgi:hypothetical protein
VKRTKRFIQTEATLAAGDGTERAHAWATFLALPRAEPDSRGPL